MTRKWWTLAGTSAGLFLLIAAIIYPSGMGLGDVKLVTLEGAFLGAPVAIAMFAGRSRTASLIASIPSIV